MRYVAVPPVIRSPHHSIGVRELRAGYATEQFRPQQIVDLALERIAARGEDAVWISRCPDRELHRRAADLDRIRRERGMARMPLFGVPCAVKDNIDVPGLATTAACPAFSYRPTRSASCVQRLIDAGAIVSGNECHNTVCHSRARLAVPVPTELDFEGDDGMRDGPWVAERLAELEEFFAQHPEDVLPITRQLIEGGRQFDAVATFRAWHRRQELHRWTEQLWQRAELLIMPTVPTTFTVDEIAEEPVRRNTVLGRYTQFVNLLDLAAVTVPAGRTADGRPASITLIGPAFSEPLLLSVANRLAARTHLADP